MSSPLMSNHSKSFGVIFWAVTGWVIVQSYLMLAAYSVVDEYQLFFTGRHLSLTQIDWLHLFVCPLVFSAPSALAVAILVKYRSGFRRWRWQQGA